MLSNLSQNKVFTNILTHCLINQHKSITDAFLKIHLINILFQIL